MKKLRTFARFCAALFACISFNTFAQPTIKLEHDSSWEIIGRECNIRVLQLANLSGEDTGPLFLSIYAKASTGFDGTGSPGALVARASIAPLAANATVQNLEVTTKARLLPSGEKFTTLVVEQQNGRRFAVLDYVVYTSTYTFPRRQNGGVGSDDSAIGSGDIVLRGANSLTVTGRRADFSIEEIQNERAVAASGPLRLAIYATREPYNGSGDRVIVATRALGELAQGDFYNHLQGRLIMKRPGRGTFYLTLALEEDTGSGFQTVVYVSYPDPRSF